MVCLCECSARTVGKAKPMRNYSVHAAVLRQTDSPMRGRRKQTAVNDVLRLGEILEPKTSVVQLGHQPCVIYVITTKYFVFFT